MRTRMGAPALHPFFASRDVPFGESFSDHRSITYKHAYIPYSHPETDNASLLLSAVC